MSATPRPWRRCSCGKCGQVHSIPADVVVLTCESEYPASDAPLPTLKESYENAELIVLAVNAYDAHVQAVEALSRLVDYCAQLELLVYPDADGGVLHPVVGQSLAALHAVDEASK